jgi:hypothetical protein
MFRAIAILLLPLLSFSQADPKPFEEIQRQCELIKKELSSYKKVIKYKDSTGTRSVFLKNGELKLTRAEQREPTIDRTVEWYFNNGEIIYCEQKWILRSNNSVFNNEKLYLKDGKLLLWVNSEGKTVDPNSGAFKETAFSLINYSKQLLKEASEP